MSDKKLKVVFGVEGDEKKYAVKRPGPKEHTEGQKAHNRAFKEAIDSDAFVAARLDDILRKQSLWDDAKKAQVDELYKQIASAEKKLAKGGMKLSEGKTLCLSLWKLRRELNSVLSVRLQYSEMTAEAQAENVRFNSLVSSCLVYNESGEKVYKDLQDYMDHADEPRAYEGATQLSRMLGGGDPDYQKKLPENRFLFKHGFVDDKLRLINKQGRLVDVDGRLIDDEGNYINAEGKRVNRDGERVDENGEFVFDDALPFLDEEGRPLAAEAIPELVTGDAKELVAVGP